VTAAPVRVRPATTDDAEACAAVYAPYVRTTAASFESEPPHGREMAARIAAALARHACETSVYVAGAGQGRGTGRALYEALLPRLAERGFRTVVAGMTLPNPASAALHAALGFRQVGLLEGVGFKLGRWHDVALLERSLGHDPYAGAPPGAA
jgi:L-amino acid N-acyltransferase YncA